MSISEKKIVNKVTAELENFILAYFFHYFVEFLVFQKIIVGFFLDSFDSCRVLKHQFQILLNMHVIPLHFYKKHEFLKSLRVELLVFAQRLKEQVFENKKLFHIQVKLLVQLSEPSSEYFLAI